MFHIQAVLNHSGQFASMFGGEGADMRGHVLHRSEEDEEGDDEVDAGGIKPFHSQMNQILVQIEVRFRNGFLDRLFLLLWRHVVVVVILLSFSFVLVFFLGGD